MKSNLCLTYASTIISVKLEYTNIFDENLMGDTVGGSVTNTLYRNYQFLVKLKILNSSNPVLCKHPKPFPQEHKETCIRKFIAALFIIGK